MLNVSPCNVFNILITDPSGLLSEANNPTRVVYTHRTTSEFTNVYVNGVLVRRLYPNSADSDSGSSSSSDESGDSSNSSVSREVSQSHEGDIKENSVNRRHSPSTGGVVRSGGSSHISSDFEVSSSGSSGSGEAQLSSYDVSSLSHSTIDLQQEATADSCDDVKSPSLSDETISIASTVTKDAAHTHPEVFSDAAEMVALNSELAQTMRLLNKYRHKHSE